MSRCPFRSSRPSAYRIPDELRERALLGTQVVVPFRARLVTGFIVGTGRRPELDPGVEIKGIREVIEGVPLVTPELLELAGWIAGHYLASLGEVLHSVFPPGVARSAERRVRLAPQPSAGALDAGRARGGATARLLEHLLQHGEQSLASLTRSRGGEATGRALARAEGAWGSSKR